MVLISFPARVAAAPIPVDTTLLSNADPELDGKTVRFRGEALGEALRADEGHRWINVLDGAVAIGVYTPNELVGVVDGYGEWTRTGTLVEVTGTYNVACPMHGGDLDVHANELVRIESATDREHPVQPWKALAAAAFLAVSAALAVRFRVARRRQYQALQPSVFRGYQSTMRRLPTSDRTCVASCTTSRQPL